MNEREIFDAALAINDPTEQAKFLVRACGDDSVQRRRIEELLEAQQRLGSFLESPAAPTIDLPSLEMPGTQIGPYKLLQQIGEGGMGTVFMAEQTHPVQRKVALKLIKAGMDSRQIIARFEAERQALAMMDHVNIARVLDAGTTDQGRPYFVMELVNGVPITKYCDDNHLTPRQRLELFVPVCQAIQHAHQKGIIHRDIKPSNVMITLYDGKPVPKVIDFGVAKATEQKLTERTLFTQFGMMVGTLEYMSPEQAEMSALGVDTRSDIYSLGVLLYELLTGSTPLSRKQMKEAAFAEILRLIKEEEPPKPSTRLSESGEALASISAQRHMEPAKLSKLMRGELDWIVMKTLEKDRNRRYETANGFAADVQRYLDDEPVQACPPSRGYRLKKFIRRNKVGVAFAASVALLVVLGVIGLAVSNVIIAQERAEALRQRDEVKRQRQFARHAVDKMFTEVATKWLAGQAGLEPLQKQFLLDALHFYEELVKEEGDDPEIRLETANAYSRMGNIHYRFGNVVEAEKAHKKAHELLSRLVSQSPSTAAYREALATNYEWHGYLIHFADRQPEALELYRKGLEEFETLAAEFPQEPTYQLGLASGLGNVGDLTYRLNGPTPDLEAVFRRCIALNESLPSELALIPDTRIDLAWRLQVLTEFLRGEGRHKEADVLSRKGKDIMEKLISEYPKNVSYSVQLIYSLHDEAGIRAQFEPEVAESAYRRALAICKEAVAQSPEIPGLQYHLGFSYTALGRHLCSRGQLGEAESAFSLSIAALETLQKNFPDHRPNAVRAWLVWTAREMASLLERSNRLEESERAYRQALAHAEPFYPEQASLVHESYRDLANLLKTTGRSAEALALLQKSLEIANKFVVDSPGKSEYRVFLAQVHDHLATHLANVKEVAEANRHLEKVAAEYTKVIELNPDDADGWSSRGAAYFKLGQWDKAVADYAKAIELKPDDPTHRNTLAFAYWERGGVLQAEGRWPEAVKAFRQSLGHYEKLKAAVMVAHNYGALGNALQQTGQREEAEKADLRAIAIWEELAAEFPSDWNYRQNLAHAHLRLGQHDKALAEFTKAIEIDPKAALSWWARGGTHASLNQWDKALADHSKAVELCPDDADLWHHRAAAYIQLNQLDNALADLSTAVEKSPDNWWHWSERAGVYGCLNQWDMALADYSKGLELNPTHADMWLARAGAYVKLNQLDKAVGDLRGAVTNGFKDAEHLKNAPEFEPLRSHDDFKKLIGELDVKK